MPKILIVDDTEDSVTLLRYNLEDDGYEVFTASDGIEALSVAEKELPDVILLDVMMPRLDGVQTCKKLKENTSLAHIPVIMVSAKDERADVVEGLDVGAQDYITKPIDYTTAAARIRSALRIKEYGDSLRTLNAELKSAKEDTEKALKARTAFFSTMSHEIRTPITAIMGYSEILASKDGTRKQFDTTKAAELILGNSQYLLDVINNILDFSKAESGLDEVELLSCSVFKLLEDVENVLLLKASEKKLHFSIEYSYPLPRFLQTDPIKFKQVMLNLCSNAIKFTQSGSVLVRCSFDESSRELKLEVEDTGIGMSPEAVENTFTPFFQENSSIARRFGGTGLGLSISKDIVEKLGGTISVESEKGKGSVFRVCFPLGSDELSLVTERPNAEDSSNSMKSFRLKGEVLVVEDEPTNLRLLQYLLQRLGVKVTTATNGEEALVAVDFDTFDLILMDMHMPKMKGDEVTKRLLSKGVDYPIIALTATQDPDEVDAMIDAGCREYLPKPFRKDELFSLMQKYLSTIGAEDDDAEDLDDFEDSPEFARIVVGFLSRLSKRLATIEAAFAARDWPELTLAAHNLQGAKLFGFSQIALLARLLEEQSKKENVQGSSELVERIKKRVEEIVNERGERGSATESEEEASH